MMALLAPQLLSLFLGVAQAQAPALPEEEAVEFVLRLDDRDTRSLSEPRVTLLYPDGRSVEAPALDDGTDAQDKFAGDHLWVARLRAPEPGRVWALISDTVEDKSRTLLRKPIIIGAKGGLNQIKVQTLEAESESAPLAADGEPTREQDEPAEARPDSPQTSALKGQPDFPLAAAAEVDTREVSFQPWASNAVSALVTLGIGAAMLAFLLRDTLRRTLVRLGAVRDGVPIPLETPPEVPRWTTAVALVCAIGLLLAVWVPGLRHLKTDFLGIEYVDHYGTQWFYWFVDYNKQHGLTADTTKMFFFPWGKDIFKHTGSNVLDAVLAIPFRHLFGPVLGYNVFVLLGYALTGLAFYRLARELSEDRIACAIGSILFTLQPYLLLEILEGRPTQGVALLPVLFFWALIRSGLKRGIWAPVLGGVMLALSGYQYWFYALFGGLAALVHGTWRTIIPAPGSGGRVATLARHATMAAVALGMTLPVALPMVIAASGGEEVPGLLDTETWSWAASPPITREGIRIGLFSWQPLRAAMGFLVIDASGNERFLAQYVAIPWVFSLVLLVWFRRPGRLDRGTFLSMAIVLTLIAMGPVLLIGTSALPNVFYIYLVKSVGFLRRLWWPSRCLLFIVLLFSLALVQALSWLRRQPPRFQAAGFVGLTAWWAWDLRDIGTLPFPTWDGTVPAGYRCLASGDTSGAVIELPYAWTQGHLYFQTYHERPLLGGMLEDNPTFTPPEFTEFRTTNPMVSRLLWGDPIGNPFDWDSKAEDEVYELGYRYLVVQKDAFYHPADEDGPNRLEVLLKSLDLAFGGYIYDDGRIAIYAPWDDPLPCDLATLVPDPAPVGPTEAKQEVREPDPADQIFTRVLTKPADETTAAATE